MGSRRSVRALLAVAALVLAGATAELAASTDEAQAAACSTTTGAASCTISASLTVTAGTLTLISSPNLYWSIVNTGYDQWASASSAALTSCAASSTVTHCSSGAAPTLLALDATGSGSGWAVSEYLSSSTLPTGYSLKFNGAGSSTIGWSSASPVATDPFAATTPGNICDYGSTCTTATAAATCSHAGIGFSSCPSYAVSMGGADSTHQVDLYSAQAATGLGAICFASGSASSAGCSGATSTAFYNLGIRSSTSAGSSAVTINMAINSGP